MSGWTIRGVELVKALRNVKTDSEIKKLCLAVIEEIRNAYPVSLNSRKTPLSEVRKTVLNAFPDTPEQEKPWQYFTNKGKGNVERYQHLALKYLTLSTEEWDVIGDVNRKEWKEVQPKPETQLKLSDMKLEQLELDADTQQIVTDALEYSEESLAEFIQLACKIRAKTIMGKVKKGCEDLANVSTIELLNTENKALKTHPKKIEELTKRAIRAIEIYNDEIATEQYQKWFISATAIHALTGSRVQSVNEILQNCKIGIDDHNTKHGLTAYTNRGNGRKIENDINLIEMVPNGLNF